MIHWRILIGATCATACVVAGLGDLAAAAEPITIAHQGIERTAVVHRSAIVSGPSPLVLALHGLRQSVESLRTHQIPSISARASPESEKRMGLRNRDIETADEIWAFFKNFSRKP